jgi:hypothetical protein
MVTSNSRPSVTIHNLDVQFDVEAGRDEAVFARLFERHITAWQRLKEEAESRRRLSERDRALGDRGEGWVS